MKRLSEEELDRLLLCRDSDYPDVDVPMAQDELTSLIEELRERRAADKLTMPALTSAERELMARTRREIAAFGFVHEDGSKPLISTRALVVLVRLARES